MSTKPINKRLELNPQATYDVTTPKLNVAAAPVGMTAMTPTEPKTTTLDKMITVMQQALQTGEKAYQIKAEQVYEEGQKQALNNEKLSNAGLWQQQLEKGYYEVQAKLDVTSEYQRELNQIYNDNPEISLEELQNKINQVTQKYLTKQPKSYRDTFTEYAIPIENTIINKHIARLQKEAKQQVLNKINQTSFETINTTINTWLSKTPLATIGDLNKIATETPEVLEATLNNAKFKTAITTDLRTKLQELQDNGKTLGLTTSQVSQLFIQQLGEVAIQYGMPELLDIADIKDKNGISLAKTELEPYIQQYKERAEQQREQIIKQKDIVQQQKLKQQTEELKNNYELQTANIVMLLTSKDPADIQKGMQQANVLRQTLSNEEILKQLGSSAVDMYTKINQAYVTDANNILKTKKETLSNMYSIQTSNILSLLNSKAPEDIKEGLKRAEELKKQLISKDVLNVLQGKAADYYEQLNNAIVNVNNNQIASNQNKTINNTKFSLEKEVEETINQKDTLSTKEFNSKIKNLKDKLSDNVDILGAETTYKLYTKLINATNTKVQQKTKEETNKLLVKLSNKYTDIKALFDKGNTTAALQQAKALKQELLNENTIKILGTKASDLYSNIVDTINLYTKTQKTKTISKQALGIEKQVTQILSLIKQGNTKEITKNKDKIQKLQETLLSQKTLDIMGDKALSLYSQVSNALIKYNQTLKTTEQKAPTEYLAEAKQLLTQAKEASTLDEYYAIQKKAEAALQSFLNSKDYKTFSETAFSKIYDTLSSIITNGDGIFADTSDINTYNTLNYQVITGQLSLEDLNIALQNRELTKADYRTLMNKYLEQQQQPIKIDSQQLSLINKARQSIINLFALDPTTNILNPSISSSIGTQFDIALDNWQRAEIANGRQPTYLDFMQQVVTPLLKANGKTINDLLVPAKTEVNTNSIYQAAVSDIAKEVIKNNTTYSKWLHKAQKPGVNVVTNKTEETINQINQELSSKFSKIPTLSTDINEALKQVGATSLQSLSAKYGIPATTPENKYILLHRANFATHGVDIPHLQQYLKTKGLEDNEINDYIVLYGFHVGHTIINLVRQQNPLALPQDLYSTLEDTYLSLGFNKQYIPNLIREVMSVNPAEATSNVITNDFIQKVR